MAAKKPARAVGLRGEDSAAAKRGRNVPAPAPSPPSTSTRRTAPRPATLGNQQQQPPAARVTHPGRERTREVNAAPTTAGSTASPAPATRPAPPTAPTAASVAAPATTSAKDEEAISVPRDLEDAEAVGGAIAQWHAEPIERLVPKPVPAMFFVPSAIALTLLPKQPPGKGPPPKQSVAANLDALRVASETYASIVATAQTQHDALRNAARVQQNELIARVENTFARIDDSLQPQIDALRVTLDDGRRTLDEAAANAEMLIAQQAARARRLIAGAAAAARQRVAAAVAAVEGQLPGIKKGLRDRFDALYKDNSKKVADSGSTTSASLASAETKTRTANAIPEGDTPEIKAQTEAKRKVVPSQLDELSAHIKTQSAAQAKFIGDRMTMAPPGGLSLEGNLDAFIDALRKHLQGGTEGGKTTESLGTRGNKAIDKAQSEALSSLQEQVAAAVRAVRHARASGERQIATQREAALTRLSGVRRAAVAGMREQAHGALGTLAKATTTALPLYADAVKRLDGTLRETANLGAAALTRAAQTAAAPVARSLVEGRTQQAARLAQVTRDASRGVANQAMEMPLEAERAQQEFSFTMRDIASGLARDIAETAAQQTASLHTVARSVGSAADTFTQPLPKMFEATIKDQTKLLDPVYTAESTSVTADAKRITDDHQAKLKNPLAPFADTLARIAESVDGALETRKKNAHVAIDKVDLDEDALMAAFRALTPIQAEAVEYKYNANFPNLRAYLKEQHDAKLSGLSDDEYNSIISALNGDPVAAARFELKTTVHWYGNEGERAAAIMDALSEKDRKTLVASAEYKAIAPDIKSGMVGSSLSIYEALEQGKRARAEAIRTKDRIDAARDVNDHAALIKSVTELGASESDRAILNPDEVPPSEAERRAEVQREFATLPGVLKEKGEGPLTQEQAAEALAAYATRDVTVPMEGGGAEPMGGGAAGGGTITYHLDDVTNLLVTNIAKTGPDSRDSKAARILYEGEKRGDDKPDLAALEAAAVDPRLNPTLTPDLTPEQRAAARAEVDQMYLRYAEYARTHNVPGAPANAEEARRLAASRLARRYDDSASGITGQAYVTSIVLKDRPDPVLAMRYAMLGAGTDVPLIKRTLGRLSRDEIDQLHRDYNATYGEDMFYQLGVFGLNSLGEVSGDDRLGIERDLLGVPRNDKERAEAALFANQQQLNERGVLDVNEGSAEERILFEAQSRLRGSIGGAVQLDRYGRPTVIGGNFDAKGKYSGTDRDRFGRDLNYSRSAVDMYTARIDRIASYVTTGIAIIGAVVAAVVTVVTGGAALPLMAVAFAAGLASMAANAAIRGGRYGWEEAAVDLAMTVVQTITAGIGAQLGAASQAAIQEAKLAGATAAQIARMSIINAAKIGATTGAITGVAGATLNEKTWEHGIGSGLGLVFEGGLKGALSGAVTAAVTTGIESIGRGGTTLGDKIQGMSASGGLARGTVNVLGRGLARSALSSAGAMAGRGSEIAFDTATGRFQGSRRDALAAIGEAGTHAAFQGFFEGAGEAGGKRYERHAPMPAERDEATRRARALEDEARAASTRTKPGEPEPPAKVTPPARDVEPRPAAVKPPPLEHEIAPPPPARPPPAENAPMKAAAPPARAEEAGGAPPPRPPAPTGGAGGESDRLFPNLTDAEIDAMFAPVEAGPHIRAPAEDLQLRIPAAQRGQYWGLDPASGMIVQEYRFRAQRGLPPLDARGNPIEGPLGSRMTRMRVHSPDPTAPAGSASRTGWTVSIEQGDLRMTMDGRWFDRRFGETPGGRRVAVDDYRRGPSGEWLAAASGRPVVDADVHAALNQWDRNMAASHIPLFPSAGGGRLPPPTTPHLPEPPPLPPAPPPKGAAPEVAKPAAPQVAERPAPATAQPPALEAPPEVAARKLAPAAEEPALRRPGEPEVTRPRPAAAEMEPETRVTAEATAAEVAGSRLSGDAADRLRVPGSHMGTVQNAARGLAEPGGTFEGRIRVTEPPGEPMQITLLARTPGEPDIPVRLQTFDPPKGSTDPIPAARYIADPDTPGGYIVQVSRGTPATEAQRALAHELAEIRAVHGTDPQEHVDALGKGGKAGRLSPHDEGRLAELDVIARQVAALPDHPDSGPARRRLLDEAQRLADHLGLLGDTQAAQDRRALAQKAVGEKNVVRALLDEAVRTAADNPFLQRPGGKVEEDLALLAKRLEHARSLGDNPEALKLRENAILEQAAEAVMRDRLVVTRERGAGKLTYDAEPLRIEALRAKLPPDQQQLLDRAVALAKRLPPLRDESRAPTRGFEAKFETEPVPRREFDLPGEHALTLRTKNGVESVTVDEAVARRRELLDRQRALRVEDADPTTSATRKAEIAREMKALIEPINKLSEALGVAAGRHFIANDPELRNGRIVEMPREGAGVPDLLVELPPHPGGRIVVVECKGGDAELNTRMSADQRVRVQQGRREYLESLAKTMERSSNEDIKAMGRRLRLQLEDELPTRYLLVRQPFDTDDEPRSPEVGEFDIRR